ncbi:hypothetical protein CR513_02435, partial [Mucuna pruriens]
MVKKESKTFKEYAQRFAHIQPLLSKKEMVTKFIDTLQPSFYEKMVGNVSLNFSDLVIIEERIEAGVRSEKIAHMGTKTTMAKKIISNTDKRKGEANAIASSSTKHDEGDRQNTSNYQPHFPSNSQMIIPPPYNHPHLYPPTYQTPHRPHINLHQATSHPHSRPLLL